jgi:PEP-CTERM motif
MKRVTWALAVLCLLVSFVAPAKADIVETFDPIGPNNQVNFQASSIYLANANGGNATGNTTTFNGFVIQNNNFAPFSTGGWGLISQGQGGSGYFLYEGTQNGSLGPNGSFQGTVWQSYTAVAVSQNTAYTFSFFLTNSESADGNLAIIQPFVNGSALGAGVSAKGSFSDGNSADKWQQFSFTWNSGTSVTANLSLVNQQTAGAGFGDDFGVDTIALTAVPEPSSFGLLCIGAVGFVGHWKRRKKNVPA